jgi:hypothetical protein
MAEEEDQDSPFDDLLMDLYGTEGRQPDYDTLCLWSERFPEYRRKFAEHFAEDAIEEMYEKLERKKEHKPQWTDGSSLAFAMQILRRQKEGIPEDTILSLTPFDQLVLSAIAALRGPRLQHVENIVAKAKTLPFPELSADLIIETLRSLETRYAVFSYTVDIKEFPDFGGKQYFFLTPIGERSLEASKKASS